ncbi:hypothetical protein, partial [Enterobacter hormaechei]|uniref:hypothetical protein n=1 Tax=Enterobacter hormaechei TaxID=158836 RepID=UPI00203ABDE5
TGLRNNLGPSYEFTIGEPGRNAVTGTCTCTPNGTTLRSTNGGRRTHADRAGVAGRTSNTTDHADNGLGIVGRHRTGCG